MQTEHPKQPPLETSLMGVVRTVFDHYGIDVSTPWLYGATAHAFVLNVHEKLCPSGPYCWDGDGWVRLLANLGINRRDLGFFSAASSPEERAAVEGEVREAVDRGVPCSHLNMDNQRIAGYDETGFVNCRPWGECVHTPARLTFGSWAELGDEVHMSFFRFERGEATDALTQAKASLAYAQSLWTDPAAHTHEPYGMGPHGYANWQQALADIDPEDHGAWWNARVWSECRAMAAKYLDEIAERFPEASEPARAAAQAYARIADRLDRVSDKAMPLAERSRLVGEASRIEALAVNQLGEVAACL